MITPPAAGRPEGDSRERKLRIMVVTDQYEPMVGGVPAVTRNLARGLAGRGHDVALVVPSPGRRGRLATAERLSVIYRGSLRWPWYEGMRLGCLPASAARTLISSFAPDVAHIHSPVTLGVMARIGAGRQRVPVVYTNHYLPANVRPSTAPRSPVLDALFYRHVVGFSNRCSYVTAPTATALRLLRERGLRVPSRVISNGADLRAYSPGPANGPIRHRYGLPASRPLILSVGRLSSEKRMDVLLDAAARLGPGTQVAIVGTGPDEARLRARAQRLGLAGTVRFLGFVPGSDLPAIYRLADVFAIVSEAELQSLATMEAMATGLPVVAVDACALGELVRPGRNGFLARPGQAAEVAAYLGLLCSDPGLRARMSAASLEIISAHERHRLLAEWESLYRMLTLAGAGER
jgi:glycosyltransferase involved in cell wall biosynthesis